MAVKTALSSKERKYDVPCCTEDASSCLSDGQDTSYIKVSHLRDLPPLPRLTSERSRALVIIIAILIISLTLNVALVAYISTEETRVNSLTPPPPHSERLEGVVDEDSVCTGCSTLGIPPEEARSARHPLLTVHKLTDGSVLCCMRNAGSLKRLAQIFADIHVQTNPSANQSDPRLTIGAHLYADSDALKKHPPSLSWSDEYGFGSAYVNNVIRNDNSLVVPKPGLYHIYSFFTFKTLQQRFSPDNVLHAVYRENRKLARLGSRLMLLDKKTLPEASDKFVTSFLSTTVRLRQDDQLYVKVSNLSYVYPFSPSNFFGLFFLGD